MNINEITENINSSAEHTTALNSQIAAVGSAASEQLSSLAATLEAISKKFVLPNR